MTSYVAAGAALGLSAGISPGPLTTLLIAESLRGGWPAGVRVALAPLVTDAVLVSLALLVLAPLPGWGFAWIGLLGGLILVWMGWGTVRSARVTGGERAGAAPGPGDGAGYPVFLRGVVTNLTNPHALLFWISSGAPLVREAAAVGWAGPVAFLAPFFALLVGVKLLMALAVSTGRRFLNSLGYRLLLAGSGLALAALGAYRAWQGAAALLAW